MSAARPTLDELLAGPSEAQLREMGIQALRQWHTGNRTSRRINIDQDFLPPFLAVLKQSKRVDDVEMHGFTSRFHDRGLAPVVDFLAYLERVGYVVPLGSTPGGHATHLHLTSAGARFLERTDDHPLLPQSVERTKQRCQGIPDEVVALLVDARTCMEHGLLRPSIVIMGVAYELAIEHITSHLETKGLVPANTRTKTASVRLDAVLKSVDSQPMKGLITSSEERAQITAACEFAEKLRLRRNHAAHTTPAYGFDDRTEVEEFLVSATRHLPALWALALV